MLVQDHNTTDPEGNAPPDFTGRIDLEAYFKRIGFEGEPSPNLVTLQEIHLKHPAAIPFENLNPLLKWPVKLDLGSLQQKLIGNGRGGYCFEHNLLLKHVLEGIGFKVRGLAARVVWNLPEGMLNPRTHMVLLVEVQGESFIADVGFGGQTLTAPLRFVADLEQPTPHEPFRLVLTGEEWILQARVREEWKPLYRFNLDEHFLPDYEVSNWYTSAHPDSHFTKGLIAARTTSEGRFTLRNGEMAVHYLGGHTEKKTLNNKEELSEVLEQVFLLKLPKDPALEAALDKEIQK